MLLLDHLERLLLADRHVAAVLIAAGRDMALPTYQERRELFDTALVAEPKPLTAVDNEQWELRRVLGVA